MGAFESSRKVIETKARRALSTTCYWSLPWVRKLGSWRGAAWGVGWRPPSWLPVARHEGMAWGQEGTRQLLPELVTQHGGSGAEGGQGPNPAAPWLTPHTSILPGTTCPPRNGVRRDLCAGECSLDLPSACCGLQTHWVDLGRGGDGSCGGWRAALKETSTGCPVRMSTLSLCVLQVPREETGGGIALPAHPPACALPRQDSVLAALPASLQEQLFSTGCRAGGKGSAWGGSIPPKPTRTSGLACSLSSLQFVLPPPSCWGFLGHPGGDREAQPGCRPLGPTVGAQQGVGPAPSLWQKRAKLPSMRY